MTDNGEGIAREDVPLAFSRYATSKIGSFDDIYRIHSFGFRGEALPSIASISRVEMTTRQVSSPAGTRAIVEGGEVKEISDIGCPCRDFDPRQPDLRSGAGPPEIPQERYDGTGVLHGRDHPSCPDAA